MFNTKIKYTSLLFGISDIKKRNKAFNALSDEDKRREIAWDSLQLILDKKTKGSNISYWSSSLLEINGNSKAFQKKLLEELPICSVCARGAMMLSQIRLGNSIDSYEFDKSSGNSRNIKGFLIEDFYNMEKEYERSYYNHPYDENTTYKLANICCNIIVNGNFDTQDKTDYLIC